MISVTLCPECQKQVAVPAGTHETADVQCPLCDSQFKLADAAPDDLPTVTIVNPGEVADDEIVAFQAHDATDAFGFDASGDDSELNLVDDSAETVDSFDLGGDQQDEVPAFSFDAGGDSDDGSATATAAVTESVTSAATEPRKKKKRKGPGFLGNMIGIVVFGMVGLGLGYGILKWIAPDRAAPIDRIIDENWAKVASLWSDSSVASDDGSGGDANPFVPGSLRDTNQDDGNNVKQGKDGPPTGRSNGGETAATDGTDPKIDAPVVDPFGPLIDPFGSPTEPATPPADEYVNKAMFDALAGDQPAGAASFKAYAADEVSSSIAKARTATRVDPFKTAYLAMCDVGGRATFLKGQAEAKDLLVEVDDLIRQIAARSRHKHLSRYSYQWMNFDLRPKHLQAADGIFLVGIVKRIAPVGTLFCSEIEIADQESTRRLLVLSGYRPDFHVGDRAGVLGSVIRDVPSRFPGLDPQDGSFEKFEAGTTTIVLGARAIQLPKESE